MIICPPYSNFDDTQAVGTSQVADAVIEKLEKT